LVLGLGVVTSFVGSGAASYVDGIGSSAGFYNPCGITVSSTGIVYVADTKNNRIRMVTGILK
jgi:hypothetical protein